MFQSLSVEQLQTCLQMAIQQLINSNSATGGSSDDDVVPQQQQQHPQQQEIEHLTAADIHQTVTNLSTEQMQQLMQLQQQASLSVLNQPNVSCDIKCQLKCLWLCVPLTQVFFVPHIFAAKNLEVLKPDLLILLYLVEFSPKHFMHSNKIVNVLF